jgi:DNA (cytosine-5)-methyltransferase 1
VQHELDKEACATLIGNRPRAFRWAALIQGDIRQTPTSMLLAEGGLRVGEAHLVTGGPPCQGFSTARGRRPAFDERNDMVFQFLRVVREAQPQFFIFENVQGFTNFNKGEYLIAFLEAAYGCYYELVYGLLNAIEYGVPQYRSRFFCMGTRRDLSEIDGKLAAMPRPETFFKADLTQLRVVGGPLFRKQYDRLTRAPGIRYFPDRPVLRPPDPIGHQEGRSQRFYDFYDRLAKEEPDRLVEGPQPDRMLVTA